MAYSTSSTQLSPSVFLHGAGSISERKLPNDRNGPRLVILATWAFARDNHIAKYIDNYRELFPNTPILVTKSFLRHVFWIPGARKELEPAAAVIRKVLSVDGHENSTSTEPLILLHLFSNSGLSTTYNLFDVYSGTIERDTRNSGEQLPLHATVFDSSPGRYGFQSVASAAMFGATPGSMISKTIIPIFAYILSSCIWIWVRVLGGEDWIGVWGQAVNNRTASAETCRSYVYSAADPLVEKQDVEGHARDAREKGFKILHQADFGESKHVAHARADPERYWRIVKETWEEQGNRGNDQVFE